MYPKIPISFLFARLLYPLKLVRFEVIPYKKVKKFNRYQFFNINPAQD